MRSLPKQLIINPLSLLCLLFVFFSSCKNIEKDKVNDDESKYPSEILTNLDQWNLILGDGTNVGKALNFRDEDFIYSEHDKSGDWVVFKTPNAGNTHGTSNNTRTELAQLKKWSPLVGGKLSANLKVMNVANTGDASVAATYSVVVGLSLIHI